MEPKLFRYRSFFGLVNPARDPQKRNNGLDANTVSDLLIVSENPGNEVNLLNYGDIDGSWCQTIMGQLVGSFRVSYGVQVLFFFTMYFAFSFVRNKVSVYERKT